MMEHMKPGDRSPWGKIQHVKVIVPHHAYLVSTASHGGVKLSREYNALVYPAWRAKGGWYEEDVDIAIPFITFQKTFDKAFENVDFDAVRSALARYYPKAYTEWWPIELQQKGAEDVLYDAAELAAPKKERPARIFRSEVGGMPVIQVDPGHTVLCDMCNREWTYDPTSGGFLFSGYAVCPACAPEQLKQIRKYGEEEAIQDVCPPGTSFADWVRGMRRR